MSIFFENAPLNEVVVGEVFVPRTDIFMSNIGDFWSTYLKSDYPNSSHAQNVHTNNEIYLDPVMGLPLPRLWLTSQDKTKLIQWQPDRLYANWRQTDGSQKYVRFDSVLNEYLRVKNCLSKYLSEYSSEELRAIRYELNYINIIQSGGGWKTYSEFGNVFKDFSWQQESRFLGSPIGFGARLNFDLPRDLGLLEVSITSAKRRDNLDSQLFKMELAASAPTEVTLKIPFADWANVAHEFIVAAFEDLTRVEMHDVWKLRKD